MYIDAGLLENLQNAKKKNTLLLARPNTYCFAWHGWEEGFFFLPVGEEGFFFCMLRRVFFFLSFFLASQGGAAYSFKFRLCLKYHF